MIINIQAPWEVNDYLNNLIDERLERLTSVNNRIQRADVFLKKGVNSGVDDKLLEIRLRLPGPELFAHAYADTYEKALADTVDKLRRQLKRKKEKTEDKRAAKLK